MADTRDLTALWQDSIKQLRAAGAALTGPSAELLRPVLEPLQRQAELLEETVRRQANLETQLGRLLTPYRVTVDAMEKTAASMRAQADAFQAAAMSFDQAARLLKAQADLIDTSARSLRDPVAMLRAGEDEAKSKG